MYINKPRTNSWDNLQRMVTPDRQQALPVSIVVPETHTLWPTLPAPRALLLAEDTQNTTLGLYRADAAGLFRSVSAADNGEIGDYLILCSRGPTGMAEYARRITTVRLLGRDSDGHWCVDNGSANERLETCIRRVDADRVLIYRPFDDISDAE